VVSITTNAHDFSSKKSVKKGLQKMDMRNEDLREFFMGMVLEAMGQDEEGTRGLTAIQKDMLRRLDDSSSTNDDFVFLWEYFDEILTTMVDSFNQPYSCIVLSDVFHYVEKHKPRYKAIKGLS